MAAGIAPIRCGVRQIILVVRTWFRTLTNTVGKLLVLLPALDTTIRYKADLQSQDLCLYPSPAQSFPTR